MLCVVYYDRLFSAYSADFAKENDSECAFRCHLKSYVNLYFRSSLDFSFYLLTFVLLGLPSSI